jgi:D-alanyl-D-alanine dipeptidase
MDIRARYRGWRPLVRLTQVRYRFPHDDAAECPTGLSAGAAIDVTLTADATPRSVDLPADFMDAMHEAGVRPFFDQLSNSLQRYHVDSVNGAKTDDTRRRRIDKSVALFRDGKQR